MTAYLALAGILIVSLIGLVIVHAIVNRAVRYCGYESVPPQTIAMGTILAGNIPVDYLAWTGVLKNQGGSPLEILCGFVYVLMTYNACCFCYLNILNASETSLHVNILMRLLIKDGTSAEELSRIYGVKDMISARIDRMVALGQLKEQDGRYFLCNNTLILVGHAINVWRKVLRLPLSPG